VPATVGALLEPLAVCLQAIARAGAVQGRDVLVAGDGPWKYHCALAVQAARAASWSRAGNPFASHESSGDPAKSAPKPPWISPFSPVSSAEAAVACLAALRPRGRLVVFSALSEPTALDLGSLHLRELEIVGACNDEERLDEALRGLSDPELALPEIVTHALPFARWPEAFALARDGHDRALKVALTFPETT
jgi:threonine dehydrogenase-like Zn-dependent dehydrogenase